MSADQIVAPEPSAASPQQARIPMAAHRFAVLDGWRALSILLVLLGHLLPLGPASLGLNNAVAACGMVIFFILSGFLITRFLSEGADLRSFLIRRFFRIIPLAWTAMVVILIATNAPGSAWFGNLLFYANLPPQTLVVPSGSHLWSLCVEMQFYVGIAAFVAIARRRSLILVVFFALAVTAMRVYSHAYLDIVTWRRGDEILCGSVLALIYAGRYGRLPQRVLEWINAWWLLPLLLLAAHPFGGPLNYARPYIAMLAVGSTLFAPPPLMARIFESRIAAYIATVSYAVYIIHGALGASWLGTGPTLVKYAKRPLLLAATFGLAHLSTFYFERPLNEWARRRTRGRSIRIGA